MGITHSGIPRPTPYYKKQMIFVDGTNFLCELAQEFGVPFRADKPPFESLSIAKALIDPFCRGQDIVIIRKYWFSSYQGNEEYHDQLARELRKNDFEPILFKRKEGREKGVDIALAKEMLVNSFNQNLDIALLVAGDEDYVGLVTEIKRYGPMVYGAFFRHGLSEKLELAFDSFIDMADRNSGFLNGPKCHELVEEMKKSQTMPTAREKIMISQTQKEMVLNYLRQNDGKWKTLEEINIGLKGEVVYPGKYARKLKEEGIIECDNSRKPFLYRYSTNQPT